MTNNTEKLTRKNVDEQVEQYLSLQEPPNGQPLARTIQHLQRVYEEDRRLEYVWARIQDRAAALNTERSTQHPRELVLLARRNTHVLQRTSQGSLHWIWFGILMGLLATISVLSVLIWHYALHGL